MNPSGQIGDIVFNDGIRFVNTTDIYRYAPILEGLVDVFGYSYWKSILTSCRILPRSFYGQNKYKITFLIEWGEKPVGLCGLYSQSDYSTEELWLAWFGILPQFRNIGLGTKTIKHLESFAHGLGCKKLMSYVDKDGKPLEFYKRCGFSIEGTVKDYLLKNQHISFDNAFEDYRDFIISKRI